MARIYDKLVIYSTALAAVGLLAFVINFSAGVAHAQVSGSTTLKFPSPDSTLPGSEQVFVWSKVEGASQYWLEISSKPPATDGSVKHDIFTRSTGSNTFVNATGLPTDGSTLYVRVWFLRGFFVGGVWSFNDFTVRAATVI